MTFSAGSAAELDALAEAELSALADAELAADEAAELLPDEPHAASPRQHTQSTVTKMTAKCFLMVSPFPFGWLL